MAQLRTLKMLICVFALVPISKGNAQEAAKLFYPESALMQIYTKEQIERKKADELEMKAMEKQNQLETQRRNVEQQIQAHRFNIEGLKIRQEKAQGELDALNTDLSHVNSDLASFQTEHQQLEEAAKATVNYLQSQRDEYAQKQKDLEKTIDELARLRKKSEHEIYSLGVEIERYKVAVAKADTKAQEAEAKRAALEADEMKVRADWLQMKTTAAEHMRQRDEAIAQMNEAKKRFDIAKKDLDVATADANKAQRMRDETSRQVKNNIARYDADIAASNKRRLAAEAERIRLESETAKLMDYAARSKDFRDQAVEQEEGSTGLVMKSSLALESARSALAGSIEKADQAMFRVEKAKDQARGIAAASEASAIMNGGRFWVVGSETCKAYQGMNKSKPAGVFSPGSRVMAKERGTNWVEVVNGSGSSVFMESRCGKYEN